jgi:hypothetical protein
VARRSSESVVLVKNGKQRLLPLAQARSFNVYTQKELVLAVGDSVRIQVIVSVFRIWKPGNPQVFI